MKNKMSLNNNKKRQRIKKRAKNIFLLGIYKHFKIKKTPFNKR